MNANLTKFTNVLNARCGCAHCQINVISALGINNREGSATASALQMLCSAAEEKLNEGELRIVWQAWDKAQQLPAHIFAANGGETLNLLQLLCSANPYYCIAVCILNPNNPLPTYEHRIVLVKGDAPNQVFAIHAYNREDHGVAMRPTVTVLQDGAARITTSFKTLLSTTATTIDKRAAYVNVCCGSEEHLGPVLDQIDWEDMSPSVIGIGFQGAGYRIDEFCEAYSKLSNK